MNHKGRNGTALHNAVDEGSPDVVQVLIDAGADIEAKDEKGRSPLHCASSSGALPVVKMLVEAGAGVRATDNEGDTCLILAAHCGCTETVRYLAGLPEVDVKQTDRLGNTAQEAVPEQVNATKEDVEALKEMMKSVMDQQKEQKGMMEAWETDSEYSEQVVFAPCSRCAAKGDCLAEAIAGLNTVHLLCILVICIYCCGPLFPIVYDLAVFPYRAYWRFGMIDSGVRSFW